jgi:hypothetical protein
MGTQSTFKIYDDEFQSGMTEVMTQQANAFNEASGNALQLVPSFHRGNFAAEAFFSEIASLIKHRDPLATSPQAPDDLSQEELIMPKLNRLYKVAKTRDAFKKIFPSGASAQEFSIILGRQVAQAKIVDYLNTAIAAAVGAMESNADIQTDITSASTTTLSYESLVNGTWKFGDRAQDIIAYVMHSAQAARLNIQSIGVEVDRVAGAAIYEGAFGALGRRLIVSDSPSLVESVGSAPAVNHFKTLGLTEGGVVVLESESDDNVPYFNIDDTTQNLIYRISGEHAYNVRCKGYSYTDTGVSPTNADLLDDSNWAKVATSNKSTAGILIRSL